MRGLGGWGVSWDGRVVRGWGGGCGGCEGFEGVVLGLRGGCEVGRGGL